MQLSFLIQLILLLLLVLGVYLVFTNSVSGRKKLIIIVFCVVIGLYLYSKLNLFTSYNEYYSVPQSAKTEYDISGSSLKQSAGQFALSIWVFIDDWNYKYGQDKVILNKVLPSDRGSISIPSIALDPYKNDLVITMDTFESGETSFQDVLTAALTTAGVTPNTATTYNCSGEVIYDASGVTTGVSCADLSGQYDTNAVTFENINMQKWVNIITTVSNRSLDIYINGKLVKTKTFNNLIDTDAFNYGGIQLTPGGGFGGYISKFRYYPYYITPQTAWGIYKDGFGDAFESALGKYNMAVSFYEDQIEQNKFYLF